MATTVAAAAAVVLAPSTDALSTMENTENPCGEERGERESVCVYVCVCVCEKKEG